MTEHEKLNINGIAIKAGISRNGIKYTEEELAKFALTLSNCPILKDHQATVDNAIGIVTNSFTINQGKSVDYQGWVKEDGTGILEKIKDGRIKEVSIGATAGRLVRESDDSDVVLAQDIRGLELSLTPVPGVIGTSLSHTLENLKQGKKVSLMENVNSFIKEGADISPSVGAEHGAVPNTDVQKGGSSGQKLPNQGADGPAKNSPVKCPECGASFADHNALQKHMDSVHEGSVNQRYNMLVKTLADLGVKAKHENYEKYQEEQNAKMMSEIRNVQEQVKVFEAEKRNLLVAEYKKLASERKIKERDLTSISNEVLQILVEDLKSISVDLTKGRVVNVENKSPINIVETVQYGNKALLLENGVLIEKYGDKFAITCDPAKLKTESESGKVNVRWRAYKNPSPSYV